MGRVRQLVVQLLLVGAVVAGIGATRAPAASAASLPTVVTGPVSGLEPTAATLSGDVDPNGSATNWYFQYGTAVGYGSSTPSHTAGQGSVTVGVSSGLTGLTPGTTYHYRLVAVSSAGTGLGSDASFTTPARAPTVTTKAASSIGDTVAHLNGSVDANGLATIWYFRYGTTTNYASSTPAKSAGSGTGVTGVSIAVGHLTPNTAYHFALVATNAAGASTGADDVLVTRGPPASVTGSAAAITSTSATLTGSVDPDGHSTTWYFQYGPSLGYGSTTPARQVGSGTSPHSLSIGITGLAPGTTYHYRLVATNSSGSGIGADATFATPGPTLFTSGSPVVYGRASTLSGTVPDGLANQVVTVFEQKLPAASFVALATVLTSAGGGWSFVVRARIETSYKVLWSGSSSPVVSIGVEPSVTMRARSGGQFVTRVTGARSFSGRLVRLQRRVRGVWRTIAARRLDRTSTLVFHPTLPAGTSRLRAFLTAYQAGAGYLAGYSAVHTYHSR